MHPSARPAGAPGLRVRRASMSKEPTLLPVTGSPTAAPDTTAVAPAAPTAAAQQRWKAVLATPSKASSTLDASAAAPVAAAATSSAPTAARQPQEGHPLRRRQQRPSKPRSCRRDGYHSPEPKCAQPLHELGQALGVIPPCHLAVAPVTLCGYSEAVLPAVCQPALPTGTQKLPLLVRLLLLLLPLLLGALDFCAAGAAAAVGAWLPPPSPLFSCAAAAGAAAAPDGPWRSWLSRCGQLEDAAVPGGRGLFPGGWQVWVAREAMVSGVAKEQPGQQQQQGSGTARSICQCQGALAW